MGSIGSFYEAYEFCKEYLAATGGSLTNFRRAYLDHQLRLGQSFFIALHPDDQEFLRGTPADPFYTHRVADIYKAIEALLDRTTKEQ